MFVCLFPISDVYGKIIFVSLPCLALLEGFEHLAALGLIQGRIACPQLWAANLLRSCCHHPDTSGDRATSGEKRNSIRSKVRRVKTPR